MSRDLHDQLTKYLTDAHSIEEQALAQMQAAPQISRDREIAAAFSEHLRETEAHERLVRERRDDHPRGHDGVGVAAEFARALTLPDQTLNRPPTLQQAACPGREHVGRLGDDLADEQALPEASLQCE